MFPIFKLRVTATPIDAFRVMMLGIVAVGIGWGLSVWAVADLFLPTLPAVIAGMLAPVVVPLLRLDVTVTDR